MNKKPEIWVPIKALIMCIQLEIVIWSERLLEDLVWEWNCKYFTKSVSFPDEIGHSLVF